MPYHVKLDMFEGPLDLLLHLIKENQLDIADIPMAKVTEEYLRYLALMQELDLEIAGEFLVMAATLIHIKSKMLLPPEEAAAMAEEPEEDPRAELVSRLLEYQRFKEAAATLGDREAEQQRVYTRGLPSDLVEVEGPLAISLYDLLAAFSQAIRRAEQIPDLVITPETLTVGEKIVEILDHLARESPVPFFALFARGASRGEIVVIFLALLELLRRRLASARQAEAMGEIMIYRNIEAPGADPLGAASLAVSDGGGPGAQP